VNITQLKNSVKVIRKHKKRVGRGDRSGHGGTSGKGHKGQLARSGHQRRPYFEGGQMPLIRRLPKRGFTNARFRSTIAIVNLRDLNRFDEGTEVTPELLSKKGLVKGSYDKIKILGKGDLTRKLIIHAHAFSEGVVEKAKKTNSSCQLIKSAN